MKKMTKLIVSIFIILFSSISLPTYASNRDVGFLTGGIAGGLLGSTIGKGDGQLLAVAAGALAGAVIGSSVGQNMDNSDRMVMGRTLEHNTVGQPAYWRNARTGVNYQVVPIRNVYSGRGYYCREYREVVYTGGRTYITQHTACRQRNGYWLVRN